MAKLVIGYKPGVGGVVKVMRNAADDPFSTPNNAYGKFLFNSETADIGYVDYFETCRWTNVGDGNMRFYPSGTNENNCDKVIGQYTTLQYQGVFPAG